MSGGTLMLHKGGVPVTEAELASYEAPDATPTYHAISHHDFLHRVREHLPMFGLEETRSRFAVRGGGKKFYGILDLKSSVVSDDVGLVLGMKSSYDRSSSYYLPAGTRVFICDNEAFSGDIMVKRRHSTNSWKDMDYIIYDTLRQLTEMFFQKTIFFDSLKNIHLTKQESDHILMEGMRAKAIAPRFLPTVELIYRDGKIPVHQLSNQTFDSAFEKNTAWRLMNAFTQFYKGREPWQIMDESTRLSRVFANHFADWRA
jgi:Domain of unknown function (DUF932)